MVERVPDKNEVQGSIPCRSTEMEKIIPCLVNPETTCPPSCPNHSYAREFLEVAEEQLLVNLGRKPTNKEVSDAIKKTTMFERTPITYEGAFTLAGNCEKVRKGEIVLTIGK